MSDNFSDLLQDYLSDPEEAALYLDAIIESNDSGALLVGLKHVADAQGGMKKLSDAAALDRVSLYKTLREEGNPKFETLTKIVNALGMRLSIKPLDYTSLDSETGTVKFSLDDETGDICSDIEPAPDAYQNLNFFVSDECEPYHVT